ncbi:MAG: hypothetical protein WC246_00775 [Candidatus Paceibacterota bacterium]|jgi:hypothetical protein
MAKNSGYRAMMDRVRQLSGDRRANVAKVLTHLWEIDRLLVCFIFCVAIGTVALSMGAGLIAWTMEFFDASTSGILMRLFTISVTACAISGLAFWLFIFGEPCQEERHELDMLMKTNPGAAAEYRWIRQFNLPLGWTLGKSFNVTGESCNDC